MSSARVVVECAGKAMVAVAVMISVLILAANPALDTPARPLAASLLAIGTAVLVLLNLGTPSRPSRR